MRGIRNFINVYAKCEKVARPVLIKHREHGERMRTQRKLAFIQDAEFLNSN